MRVKVKVKERERERERWGSDRISVNVFLEGEISTYIRNLQYPQSEFSPALAKQFLLRKTKMKVNP